MPVIVGIDVGGTKMNAVLFDGQKVIADYKLATPKDTLDHFLIMLNALSPGSIEQMHVRVYIYFMAASNVLPNS